jgi:predicted nucleic acid-binding protein
MKLVLDSSVAVKWVIPEVDSDKAVRLRDEFVQRVHDLIAPEFFPIEVAHALTKAERQGRITAPQATPRRAVLRRQTTKVLVTSPQRRKGLCSADQRCPTHFRTRSGAHRLRRG